MNRHVKPVVYWWMAASAGFVWVILLAGCPLADTVSSELLAAAVHPALNQPADAPFAVVGEDGNSMLIVPTHVTWTAGGSVAVPYPPRDVTSVDLTTFETEVVLEDITAFPGEIIANGRWLVWEDYAENAVKVQERDSGAVSPYLGGLEGQSPLWPGMFGLATLSDSYLVVYAYSCYGTITESMLDPGCTDFILLNLPSGEETRVAGVHGSPGACAVNQTFFAFYGYSADKGWEHGQIELVNLQTGEREVIVPRCGMPSADLFAMDEDRLVWEQLKEDGSGSAVMSYDLRTRETTTVLELADFAPPDGYRLACDVRGEQILSETVLPAGFLGSNVLPELISFDGEITQIVEFHNGVIEPANYYTDRPCFVGDFVVWTDPMTGAFEIYDLESGSTRTFDPMTE